MKKYFFLLALIATLYSCTTAMQNKPDKRDKYVGEYRLFEYAEWWGEDRDYTAWNNYTRSYDMRWYTHSKDDSIYTLIVSKVPYDTVSLRFTIVKPFDFERVERIKKQNEEIKKRNEESICGKDEKLIDIPTPTYDDHRDVVKEYRGYVEGHKIFISDMSEGTDYHGSGYKSETTFDSVYLRNDTLRYIRHSYDQFFSDNKKTGWRTTVERCIAIKDTIK